MSTAQQLSLEGRHHSVQAEVGAADPVRFARLAEFANPGEKFPNLAGCGQSLPQAPRLSSEAAELQQRRQVRSQ